MVGDQGPEVLQEAQIDRVALVAGMDDVRPAAGAMYLWWEQQVPVGVAGPLIDPAGRQADALEMHFRRKQLYFMSTFVETIQQCVAEALHAVLPVCRVVPYQ